MSKEVDRRSVYPLFAKPIRRSEFILGKYAGLLLTLLANMVVMTVALYAVLFFLARGVPAEIQAAWDAPAIDPALLKAIALIYVNLAVVTAVALFFSSYSSPMLSAVFTLGVYVVGQFNADLKNFDRSSIRRRRSPSRAPATTCCRISRSSTSSWRWCTAFPCRRHVRRVDQRRTPRSTSRRCCSARW